jgi:hypothetical protein
VSNKETPEDRAIVARYFTGVLQNGVSDGMGLWVLVARDGTILKTGQSFRGNLTFRDKNGYLWRENSQLFVDKELEARYPGIKVGGCDNGYKQLSIAGQEIPLDYACVWIQSPVTDLRKADTPARPDVFISGKTLAVSSVNLHGRPFFLSLKFGQLITSTLLSNVQAIATDIGPKDVELKLRLLSSQWWTSEWSDWSAPIRVAYDQETTVEVPNKDSGTTHLVLRPIRLNNTD